MHDAENIATPALSCGNKNWNNLELSRTEHQKPLLMPKTHEPKTNPPVMRALTRLIDSGG
jgi:hypothetical protein